MLYYQPSRIISLLVLSGFSFFSHLSMSTYWYVVIIYTNCLFLVSASTSPLPPRSTTSLTVAAAVATTRCRPLPSSLSRLPLRSTPPPTVACRRLPLCVASAAHHRHHCHRGPRRHQQSPPRLPLRLTAAVHHPHHSCRRGPRRHHQFLPRLPLRVTATAHHRHH